MPSRPRGLALAFGLMMGASLGLASLLISPKTLRAEAPSPNKQGTLSGEAEEGDSSWCAPELTQLTQNVCFVAATKANAPKTLVIFLHGLTGAAPQAAWSLQARMVKMARTHGFSALVPRGRPGLGPGRRTDVLGWPTAPDLQEEVEAELLKEWRLAIRRVEAKRGAFERVLLFGFSNGAYYASNIAFRGVFPTDGVAAFAGGSGSKYQRLLAARNKGERTPMFVGYGTRDPDHKRQKEMAHMLRILGWPHRVVASRIGHTVGSSQMRAALVFLGHLKRKARKR